MRLRLLAAAFAILLLPSAVRADERILDFDSDIGIAADGTLDVREHIRVRAENNAINHGILRDIPTRYPGRAGKVSRVGFTFLDAQRDGASEPASVEPLRNGERIRIGRAETLVTPGIHDYVLHYRVTREVGHFADYDELYWNVTGNGWDFPIDHAAATLRLPTSAQFGQTSVYTGAQGSTARDATILSQGPGVIRFATTAPLAPREGLTVAAAFPKGIVTEPAAETRLGWWLGDMAPPLVGLAGLMALLFYYLVAWRRAGRDPRAGTVVPLFSPPDDLSPAAMRYIVKERMDNRGFAAALVDAGVRGHLKLVQEKHGFFGGSQTSLVRTDQAGTSPLNAPERAMLDNLVPAGELLVLEQENHSQIASTINRLGKSFAEQYEGTLFKRNAGWAAAGLGLLLFAIWLTGVTLVAADGRVAATILAAPLLLALLALGLAYVAWRSRTAGRCLAVGAAFACTVAAMFLSFPLFAFAVMSGRFFTMFIPLVALPVVISGFFWMSAPTQAGRAVLDRIAGFRQYLSITERERLDRMQAPADSLTLFERFLPYAIALDVETRWAKRFQSQLAAAAAAGAAGQQGFGWYSGSNSVWSDSGSFVQTISSSLSSTISSAATAPGSSSGSGGGGSSGGGGGGGGGGGW